MEAFYVVLGMGVLKIESKRGGKGVGRGEEEGEGGR